MARRLAMVPGSQGSGGSCSPVVSMARTSAFEQEHAIPFTIQGLKNEYEKLDKEIKYSVSLDAGKLNELQARFMNSSAKHQAPEKVFLDRAADQAWAIRSRQLQRSDEGELPTVPPAFHFDGYVFVTDMTSYDHINLYAEPTLLRDQNALEAKPQRLSSMIQTPSFPSCGYAFVLEISMYMRRHLPITRRMRGLDGSDTDRLPMTPSLCDIDGDLELVQRVECSSEHTLKDLTDEFICRNADIPKEMEGNSASSASVTHWTGADDAGFTEATSYTKYSSDPLVTDKCVMIDNCIYGCVEPCDADPKCPSYVKALLSHTFVPGSPLGHIKYGGTTLESTKLSSLPNLSFHQPYWLLHVGDCEHIWTIDAIRLLSPHEKLESFPRTVYLQRWTLTSLARQYILPKKLVTRGEKVGVPCDVCDGMRDAVVAVMGGDAAMCPKGDQMKLKGWDQIVTPCCSACFRAATGHEVNAMLGDAAPTGGNWTVMPIHGG